MGSNPGYLLKYFLNKYECILGEESLAICSRLVFGKTGQISFEWEKQ